MKFSDPAATWDKRYTASEAPLFGEKPNNWLVQTAPLLKPASQIVCVADGQGRNGIYLASLGHQVTAFDVSSVAVASANKAARAAGVAINAQVSSLEAWRWVENSLDAAVAIFIQFANPQMRAALFANLARAVRPGGLVIIEGYGLRQLRYRTGGPGVLENLYSMPILSESFAGWQMLASRDVDLDLAEGRAHLGRSHVVSVALSRPQ